MTLWRLLRLPPPSSDRLTADRSEMLKIKWNLKVIGDVAKVLLVILLLIFLIHPGRFSTLSYDIVSDRDLNKAVFIFTGNQRPDTESDSRAENLLTLQQLQREAVTRGNLSLTSPPLSYCTPAGICQPDQDRERLPLVALVVPFRDRQLQLEIFLSYMHTFLHKQNLNYTIIVVEQLSDSKFNRAKLLNVGYLHVRKQLPSCPCFIFHDVDLLPLDDRNSYVCLDRPRHM